MVQRTPLDLVVIQGELPPDLEIRQALDLGAAHLVDLETKHLVDLEAAHLVDLEAAHLVDLEAALGKALGAPVPVPALGSKRKFSKQK